jgi:hypothetical protein
MNSGKWMLASILFSFASIQASGAAVVNQFLPNTHGWTVGYDTNKIQNLIFTSTGPNTGKLTFTSVFTSTSYPDWTSGPILAFIQAFPASTIPSTALFLELNDTVENKTGLAMNRLQFGLIDFSIPANVGNQQHPGIAHFHAPPGVICTSTQLFSPFTIGGSNIIFDPICNKETLGKTIDVSGGTIANGEPANFSQFRLHEWEVFDEVRVFTFYQLPTLVPEPSSIALLGAGLLGLAAVRSRRKLRT